ncbi:T9SS type A sorting domain-containing protein [Flavobacteriaceae bacterium]|nr:T9SS type A sorting domain-containing protein [Flavobacteriaceae bacterium]MDB4183294.1 T9SS type A sorting domain-containing protein [Flavobacteriaceae bacterium]
MKKLLFLFFTLTVSSYTYSQITSFDNLPISRVLIFKMDYSQSAETGFIVPPGKLWYIQQLKTESVICGDPNDYPGNEVVYFREGAVIPEGTIIYNQNISYNYINIIEYDLDAQTISLNTNDIKLDDKMQLFPNPTNSRLSLNSDKDYNIEVFDLNGRKIMEVQGNNLDMSNLSKATYIVKAFDKASKETYSYKVIKN